MGNLLFRKSHSIFNLRSNLAAFRKNSKQNSAYVVGTQYRSGNYIELCYFVPRFPAFFDMLTSLGEKGPITLLLFFCFFFVFHFILSGLVRISSY